MTTVALDNCSNKLALHNPIPEEVQNEYLSGCCRVVYHLEMTDFDSYISEQFTSWDDLVRCIERMCEAFPDIGEFKIWTEVEDFSDQIEN